MQTKDAQVKDHVTVSTNVPTCHTPKARMKPNVLIYTYLRISLNESIRFDQKISNISVSMM